MSPLTQRLSNLWLREAPSRSMPHTFADQCLEKMVVTLRSPLTISGKVLSPSRYVLQRQEPEAGRDLVKILNADETRLIATFPTYEGPAV